MPMRVLLTIILLSCAQSAWGTEYITKDSNQLYFGERASLRRNGNIVRAWIQWVPVFKDGYEHIEGIPPSLADLKPGSKIQSVLYSFNCTDLMISTIQGVRYADLDRQQAVETWVDPQPGKLLYTYVVPGTVGEGLLEWACKTPKNKAK